MHVSRRGFTLVELMVTVAIIGILAVLATVSYRRYTRTARMAEATNMIAGIKEGQEHYKAEIGSYANISAGVAVANMYPQGGQGKAPNNQKFAWGGPCAACFNAGVSFATINVTTSEAVVFGYATMAGAGTQPPAITHADGNVNLGDGKDPWYVVRAMADVDQNSVYMSVVANNIDNRLAIDDTDE